jgi:hypothetical protein
LEFGAAQECGAAQEFGAAQRRIQRLPHGFIT